jgi:hypothetical protein
LQELPAFERMGQACDFRAFKRSGDQPSQSSVATQSVTWLRKRDTKICAAARSVAAQLAKHLGPGLQMPWGGIAQHRRSTFSPKEPSAHRLGQSGLSLETLAPVRELPLPALRQTREQPACTGSPP